MLVQTLDLALNHKLDVLQLSNRLFDDFLSLWVVSGFCNVLVVIYRVLDILHGVTLLVVRQSRRGSPLDIDTHIQPRKCGFLIGQLAHILSDPFSFQVFGVCDLQVVKQETVEVECFGKRKRFQLVPRRLRSTSVKTEGQEI